MSETGTFGEQILRKKLDEALDRVAVLEAERGTLKDERRVPLCLRMTRMEEKILEVLLSSERGGWDLLAAEVYPEREARGVLKVKICHMRKKLQAYGVNIASEWGRGPYLSKQAKMRVAWLVRREREGDPDAGGVGRGA